MHNMPGIKTATVPCVLHLDVFPHLLSRHNLHIQGLYRYGNHQGQVTVGLASILIGGLTKLLETGKELNQPSVHYRTCH